MVYSVYPNEIDTSTQLPIVTDKVTEVKAEVVNRLRDAILAIEIELGINPSGVFGSVKDRLNNLDNIITGTNSLTITCDATVTVASLVYLNGGVAFLADASDSSTCPAVGYVISKPSLTEATIQFIGLISKSGLIAGSIYYLSTLPGEMTNIPPSLTGEVLQILGHAITTNILFFNPSLLYIIL